VNIQAVEVPGHVAEVGNLLVEVVNFPNGVENQFVETVHFLAEEGEESLDAEMIALVVGTVVLVEAITPVAEVVAKLVVEVVNSMTEKEK